MSKRIRLELSDAKSSKFWEAAIDGTALTVRWGKIGTKGQSKTFSFASLAAAEAELEKKAKAKRKKGYVDASVEAAPSAEAASRADGPARPTPDEAPVLRYALPARTPLGGTAIPLSDFPKVFAFRDDGWLAALGSQSVHLVDTASGKWVSTVKTRDRSAHGAKAIRWMGEELVVGTRTIAVMDGESGEVKTSFKGHKAKANAFAHDAARLYTGGGSSTYPDDRFLRAYDRTTGELVYKVKPGKGAGAMSLVCLGERLAVVCEDGWLRCFSAADGTLLGEVELASGGGRGSTLQGVAAWTEAGVVVTVSDGRECRVHWLDLDPAPTIAATTVVTVDEAQHGCSAGTPMIGHGRVWVPVYYLVEDHRRSALLELDLEDRTLDAAHELAGHSLGGTALSRDGALAWTVSEGVTLGRLFGESPVLCSPEGASAAEPQKTKRKTRVPKKTTAAPLGEPIGTTQGGPDRRHAYDGDFTQTPSILWASTDPRGSRGEFGGNVAFGSGRVLGAQAEELLALDASTGATGWVTRCDKARTYPTSGIATSASAAFMASNKGLHAFAIDGGAPLFKASLKEVEGAPLVFRDACVVGARGGLHARSLEKKGRKLWTFEVRDRVRGAPAYADGVVYFYADARLNAVDLETRTSVFTCDARMPGRTSPVIVGDVVIYLSKEFGLAAVDRCSGEPRWATEGPLHHHGRPLAAGDDRIVLRDDEGRLHAHDAKTGERVWSSNAGRERPSGIGEGGPIVVGQTVIAVTAEEKGAGGVLSGLDLADGALRWEIDGAAVREALGIDDADPGARYRGHFGWHCTPTVADGVLYAQTNEGLIALR